MIFKPEHGLDSARSVGGETIHLDFVLPGEVQEKSLAAVRLHL